MHSDGKDSTKRGDVSKETLVKALGDANLSERPGSDSQVPWPQEDILQKPKPLKKNLRGGHFPPLNRNDSNKSVIIFPGQGVQHVGMGQKAIDQVPSTKHLFENASSILGYDLMKLCLEGPKSQLDRTEYCQPAVVVSSLAAVEVLWEIDGDAVKNCVATAGFSVGEITALIFSGALSFEDGLRLVDVRAKAMQEASDLESSGMMTIFFGNTGTCISHLSPSGDCEQILFSCFFYSKYRTGL